jgi:ketosteroid isomerase-like protein
MSLVHQASLNLQKGDFMEKSIDIVNRFYDATDNRRIDDLRALVSEDITFAGPLMKTTGSKEYVAMNEQLLQFHRGTKMLHQFEAGEDVCSIYELSMTTPAGGSLTLPIADWIHVKSGKIAAQRIYFDPREFGQAFGM